MTQSNAKDSRFGSIAIEMGLITDDKLNRALVVRRCIENRTKIHMPLGKVLKELGLLSQDQVNSVLNEQAKMNNPLNNGNGTNPDEKEIVSIPGLELIISDDRLEAFLSPTGEPIEDLSLELTKKFILDKGVVEGLVGDDVLATYLKETPLPAEPFCVARGTPPVEPVPPEIQYHFDIDPLRIGTLLEDGSMDWKNRGDIPQVNAGDVLAEKTGGSPGQPGRSVLGKDIPPPRVRETQLKNGKGAERNEDRTQIIAKVDGTPKLSSDGRVTVFTLFPIDGDIGVETGNVDFDGYVEATGAVMAGYSVRSKGLRAREIQNATIDVEEDMVSDSGVYGSTIEVGGNVKASHVHNCEMIVLGDLVIEKEVFGSTIEVNGRCLVESGKILASTIKAKKGIHVKDVGTEASKPSELIVGIDHKYERDMAEAKAQLAKMEKEKKELEASKADLESQRDEVTTLLGEAAQEQDGYMVQQRQFQEQLNGPNSVEDEEERTMLTDLIKELSQQETDVGKKIESFMEQDDKLRTQVADIARSMTTMDDQTSEVKERMEKLDEALKADPGLPIIKVGGTIYSRTKINGPHKKMILSERKQSVRIAEAKSETGGKWEFAISNLR
jgi:uncharacterized protein (DUF342 family)